MILFQKCNYHLLNSMDFDFYAARAWTHAFTQGIY